MTSRTEIAQKLEDFSYQKKKFGGFLMNKRAKASHAMWTSATRKGVTELTLLATRDYGDDNVYDVAAFTLDGTVPDGAIARLAPVAEQLADELNLREHGYTYDSLVPWDGDGKVWISKKPEFRNLSDPAQGVFVIPIQRLAGEGTPHWLAWAETDSGLNIAIVYNP